MSPELTPKQEEFCRLYLETGNASEAYRRAYDAANMKPATVNRKAFELLENGKITARIAELQAETAKRHEITIDRIVDELAAIAFSNMLDYIAVTKDGQAYVDLSALKRREAAAIQEVVVDHLPPRAVDKEDGEPVEVPVLKTRFKLADKRAALVDLGRHLGMFPSKHEVTGANGEPLIPENTSPRDIARAIVDILRTATLEASTYDRMEQAGSSPSPAAPTTRARAQTGCASASSGAASEPDDRPGNPTPRLSAKRKTITRKSTKVK